MWVFFPLCRYLCYLLFQLKTHNNLFDNDDEEASTQPALSLLAALGALAGITAIVAVASECGPPLLLGTCHHLCSIMYHTIICIS